MKRPKKLISGGQTGVDRGALDAALALGIPCGGWCPKGRLAEDGSIPNRYPLTEMGSSDYSARTEQNVIDSDGTLILNSGSLEGGTALTRVFAQRRQRPCLVIDPQAPNAVESIAEWLTDNQIETLNVAGPRASKAPGAARDAEAFLVRLFDPVSASSSPD